MIIYNKCGSDDKVNTGVNLLIILKNIIKYNII